MIKEFNTKYMYENEWTLKHKKMYEEDHEDKNGSYIKEIDEGYLLPERPLGEGKHWGIGGCLDKNKNFIEESEIVGAFGGAYDFDSTNIKYLDETIFFIPIFPNHWGHFLIDVVSRLWPLTDESYKDINIYFCSWGFKEKKLSGNYAQFFKLLGISLDHLHFVERPMKVKKILLPSFTMSFARTYNEKYKNVTERLLQNLVNIPETKNLTPYEKIYFTRTKLNTSKFKEIGEKQLEELFMTNGYKILSPEKLSLIEQAYYINHCKYMACMSGTIPHNLIFGNKDLTLFILNRTCVPNSPQLLLIKLFNTNAYFVDAYKEKTVKHPKDYGQGPFFVGITKNVKKLCEDYGYKIPDKLESKNSIKNNMKFLFSSFYYSVTRSKLAVKTYYFLNRLIKH